MPGSRKAVVSCLKLLLPFFDLPTEHRSFPSELVIHFYHFVEIRLVKFLLLDRGSRALRGVVARTEDAAVAIFCCCDVGEVAFI